MWKRKTSDYSLARHHGTQSSCPRCTASADVQVLLDVLPTSLSSVTLTSAGWHANCLTKLPVRCWWVKTRVCETVRCPLRSTWAMVDPAGLFAELPHVPVFPQSLGLHRRLVVHVSIWKREETQRGGEISAAPSHPPRGQNGKKSILCFVALHSYIDL